MCVNMDAKATSAFANSLPPFSITMTHFPKNKTITLQLQEPNSLCGLIKNLSGVRAGRAAISALLQICTASSSHIYGLVTSAGVIWRQLHSGIFTLYVFLRLAGYTFRVDCVGNFQESKFTIIKVHAKTFSRLHFDNILLL